MSFSGSSRLSRGDGGSGGKRSLITAPPSVSPDMGGKDEGSNKARPSVFSRLGTKGGGGDVCKGQSWLSGLVGDRKGGSGKSRDSKESVSNASSVLSSKKSPSAKRHSGSRGGGQRGSPAIDPNWENWDEKNLDYDDELMLEKKRQLLERELAKEAKSSKGSATTSTAVSPALASRKAIVGKRTKAALHSMSGIKADSSSGSSSSADVYATSDSTSDSDSDSEVEGLTKFDIFTSYTVIHL